MAETEPKTDEVVVEQVLEQKQEEPEVESPETAEPSNADVASSRLASNADVDESAGTDDDAEEVDDTIQRYQFRRNRQEPDEPRYEGVVRWFRADRGNYGFIEVRSEELGNPDAHVHGDNVELDSEGNIQILDEGQECTFTLLARPPPKADPTGETKYTAKEVKPGKKQKREKKIVKKYKGRCVFFNADKNKKFGFIKIDSCDDYPTGVEVFVHQDSIRGSKDSKGKATKGLVEDQEVVCELATQTVTNDKTGQEEQRSRAINVEPGKAPLEDPEKDIVFSGSVVRWVEKFEKGVDKSFGFIRLDKDQGREVMVHNTKIVSGNKVLSSSQKCKFRIQKRKDRMNPKMPMRESAIDVIPGDVPVKKILAGVVRFFDTEKGFGFIQRKGHTDSDYYCRAEAIIGPDKTLEEKQTVTFVAAPSNRPGKPRATEVRPGPKAVNGEVAELKPEETPFEAYLPAHTGAVTEKAKKKSNPNLPKHLQIQQDDTMTADEKAAALKKDFNYRKKMRRKRAIAREDSDSSSSEEKEAAPPRQQQKKAPAPLPPVVQQTSSASSKKKKSKSPKPPQQPQEQPQKQKKQQQQPKAAPVQTNSKKKTPKASSPSSGDNNSQKKQQQKKQQPQQQEQAPLQTNKKKPKRRTKNNAASKRKAKADKQQQDEEDAIDALFEANKASRDAQNASSQGLFIVVYNYILSFCKTPAPKRKLKH